MKRLNRKGYTFAEVLVASGLLGIAMGVAVSLAATMNTQVESSRVTAVATNYAENAARMWQLGLSQASIQALLPTTTNNPDLLAAIVPPSSTTQVTFANAGTYALANSMGVMDKIEVSLTIRNVSGGANRTYTLQPYMSQLR